MEHWVETDLKLPALKGVQVRDVLQGRFAAMGVAAKISGPVQSAFAQYTPIVKLAD